jgi:hypothetical protein
MKRKVHIGNKWWKIMTIYSKEVKTTRRRVEDPMKENRKECMLMRGKNRRRSKKLGRGEGKWEKKIQKQGGKCRGEEMEWMEENGWEVLNGNKQRDEEGKWTYVGSRGETVIDYGIVNEEASEKIEKFKI